MKKLVLAGAGGRGATHVISLMNELPEDVELLGIFDRNPLRAEFTLSKLKSAKFYNDFESMLDEIKPDFVLICTMDANHHIFAIKAMEKGYDVILEKPMTTDRDKCVEILEAEKRTGKKVTVTFNCRFMPFFSAIKEKLVSGLVGDILHIDLRWVLDRSHGADYFRRWHSNMENSGGLLVHKATHHFDVINWLAGESPVEVSAFGSLDFYGSRRGVPKGERCYTCDYKDSCKYYYDILGSDFDKQMYFDAERGDGYIRDKCIFRDDIDIYDNMSVNVKYESGLSLSYSLVAYSPYEGWDMVVTGTKGRLEAKTTTLPSDTSDPFEHMTFYNANGDITHFDVKKLTGDHGGSDKIMRSAIFKGGYDDILGRMASSIDGAESLLIGACANESIKTGKIINIAEIVDKYKNK